MKMMLYVVRFFPFLFKGRHQIVMNLAGDLLRKILLLVR
jgi:hypothetical protein